MFAGFGVRTMMLCSRPAGKTPQWSLADLDPEELRAELQQFEQLPHDHRPDIRDERVSRDRRTAVKPAEHANHARPGGHASSAIPANAGNTCHTETMESRGTCR